MRKLIILVSLLSIGFSVQAGQRCISYPDGQTICSNTDGSW